MTRPSRSRARASPLRTRPSRAARLRSARAGHVRKDRGHGRALPARARSPLCRAAGGAKSPRLDDLPFDGIAPPLAEPAQAPHDIFVAELFGGAAIVADHELAFVGMLDIPAGDERARSLDLVDQLVREQEFERPVDGRRPELSAAALQLGEQRVCPGRLGPPTVYR